MVLDTSAGGTLLTKTYDQAIEILDRIAKNSCEWAENDTYSRQLMLSKNVSRIEESGQLAAMSAQLQSLQAMIKNLDINRPAQDAAAHGKLYQVAQMEQTATDICYVCGDFHSRDYCPQNPESVFFVGQREGQNNQNNPYSNTYNPGWKNHPNFSWSNQNQNQSNGGQSGAYSSPPGFNSNKPSFSSAGPSQQYNQNFSRNQNNSSAHGQSESSSSLESLFKEYIARNDKMLQKNEQLIHGQASSIRNLEI